MRNMFRSFGSFFEDREFDTFFDSKDRMHWYIIMFYCYNDDGSRSYKNTLVGYDSDKITFERRMAARDAIMKGGHIKDAQFFTASYLGYMTEIEARG